MYRISTTIQLIFNVHWGNINLLAGRSSRRMKVARSVLETPPGRVKPP
jgi:hypothetical protein